MTGKQASTKRRRRYKQLSNRQRKQIMARARQEHPQEEASTINEKERNKQTFNLLVELNQKWNVYVRKLAGVDEKDSSSVLNESAQKTISKRLVQVELVGALVKLIVCRAHKEWVGKEGLIVGTTANTWRLAIGKFSPETKQRQRPKVLVVPKQGSQLMFRIPIKGRSPPLCVVVRGDCNSASVSTSGKCA